jgi:hypothetical protein
VAIHDREGRGTSWIWLLAILILAVIAYLAYYQGLLPVRPHSQASRNGTRSPEPGTPASAGRISPSAAPLSGTMPQEQGAAASSNSWYVTVAFKGVVLNESNRNPVNSATVRIYAFSSPSAAVEKTTGDDGKFQVIAPPAYRYSVRVEAEGFRPYQEDSFVITRPYYEMEVMLAPVFSLHGRVVDTLNAGIADAQVQMRRTDDRSSALLNVTTDSLGGFTFPEIPRYGRYYVEAFHAAFDSLGLAAIDVPSDNDIILRMTPARSTGSVTGMVTDSTRKPLLGAKVALIDPSDGRLLAGALTDRQGQYRFAKTREGYYLVRCTAEGFSEARSNQGVVAVYAGKESRQDFSLEPGMQIRGIVVNQKEEPVAQAQITYGAEDAQRSRIPSPEGGDPLGARMNPRGAMQRSRNLGITTTDSEGRFQILGLPDAQYQISVTHRDYQSLVISVRPSNEPQTMILDGGLSLRGTISDARGAAVERFTLTFQSTNGRSEKSYNFITTDGHFEIRGLARDTYQVSLQTQNRGRFSGPLDLQASTEIFVIMDNSRGGRGQSSLNFLKAK